MKDMTIGQVARRAGVQPSTIRYYEEIGLLPPPTRVGGRRHYDAIIFDRLAVTRVARKAGFTLREAKGLIQGFTSAGSPPIRWRHRAIQKREEVRALIERGYRMNYILETLLTCECRQIEDCGRIAREHVLR
jgi:MerR family transcriptional regulator, redox-sensitive transcriptional activator SoxR